MRGKTLNRRKVYQQKANQPEYSSKGQLSVSLKDMGLSELSICTQQRCSKSLFALLHQLLEEKMKWQAISLTPSMETEAEPLIFKGGS